MNENMYKNQIVQDNIKCIKKLGVKFIPPEKGNLACQKIGEGRLASIDTIITSIIKSLS